MSKFDRSSKLIAQDIREALETVFSGHICFPEVKNGPSYGGGLRKLDFLAIKPTWSPPCIVGIEVKVSRSDFLNDKKWVDYLPMCNQFYWACPKGLIKKEEIDPRAGLVYVNEQKKGKVYKRAVYRDQAPDWMTLLYLLLWRHERDSGWSNIEAIRREIKNDHDVGDEYAVFVSKKLTDAQEQIVALKSQLGENGRAQHELAVACEKNDVSKYDIRWIMEHLSDLQNFIRLGESMKSNFDDIGKSMVEGKKIVGQLFPQKDET